MPIWAARNEYRLRYVDGYTQQEAAKILGVGQASIVKSMLGNVSYEDGVKKTYGGTAKKLKPILLADPIIIHLLSRLEELSEEKE